MIRFRNNNQFYLAEPIEWREADRRQGLLYIMAGYRVYSEDDEKPIGCTIFQESHLLKTIWNSVGAKAFPKEFLDEMLVNLLHYLPFDPEKMMAIYQQGGGCFVYRFVRDAGQDDKEQIFDIRVEKSLEKTLQQVMFGKSVTNEKIQMAILELLYNHWQDDARTNLPAKLFYSVLPLKENRVLANLEFLKEEDCIYIQTDTSGNQVSIKIKTKGIRLVEGTAPKKVKSTKVDKRKYITKIGNITTHGAASPVNINIGEVSQAFDQEIKKIEKSSMPKKEKEEAKEALVELQTEMAGKRDENKIVALLKKLGGFSINITNWLMQNETIAPFLTYYLAKALQIPLGGS